MQAHGNSRRLTGNNEGLACGIRQLPVLYIRFSFLLALMAYEKHRKRTAVSR